MKFLKLLYSLLSASQRRRYLMLQGFYFLTAIVQIAGVASVAPFIALVSNSGLIHSNRFAQSIYDAGGFESDRSFLIAFAVCLMVLIVASNIVLALSTWFTVAFAQRLGIELQRDIFHGYIHRDYVTFSRVNSASLISMVTAGISRFVYMVVTPLLNMLSSIFVVLLIIVGLLLFNPVVALVGGLIVGAGYFLVFALVKVRLERNGFIVWQAAQAKQRLLTESLGGIKEIKLAGSEYMYEERIDAISRRSLRSDTLIGLFGDLPRFVLESIALCALLGLGIALLMSTANTSDIVGVLSLYAMAGYKLLPAAQTIFKSASQIRANVDIVRDLKPHIDVGRSAPPAVRRADDAEHMPVGDIEWHDVHYTYPGSVEPVLRGLSFRIPQNSIAVFVGASGAGKSTMADLLLGLLTPTAGDITVAGRSLSANTRSWQRNVGYVPQNIFILDDTIAANIGFGSANEIDLEKVRRAARLAQIDDFIQTLPGTYEYRVGERGAMLSGGQRQRLGIARALYHDAEVIVMDEATSALDSLTERDVIATLEQLKQTKTVVMIAHRLTTIQCADQVILVSGGRLVGVGTFEELQENNPMFREIVIAGVDDVAVNAS